jgi:prolyl oligopeptidase
MDTLDMVHGVAVADPWQWLEDAADPAVQSWMDAEDAFARGTLARMAGPRRDGLEARLRELLQVDSVTAPVRKGERWFFSRTHADRDKRVYYWQTGEEGDAQVLIDPNALSAEGRNVSVRGVWPSDDGLLAACALSENASDESELVILEVATGRELERLPGARYARPQWQPDGSGFWWTNLPTDPDVPVDQRPGLARIQFHRLGTPPEADVVVEPASGDPTRFVGPYLSPDGRWLFTYRQYGWSANDVHIRDLHMGLDAVPVPVVEGHEALFDVVAEGDWFYMHTNLGAPRYRVVRLPATTDPALLHPDNWEEVIPEHPEAVLERVDVIGGHLALTWLDNVTTRLTLARLDGTPVRSIELPGPGTSVGLVGRPEDDVAYYAYQDMITPPTIFRTELASGTTRPWFQVEVPIDASPFVAEQIFATSADGTRVPMFVLRRRDQPMDGSTPLWLYGYGGFNVSLLPWFRASVFPWLEAGGAYVVANLRGGAEFGEDWHRAGMLEQKQNVFDDFLAAARTLIERGYTSPERLAISGGSNGGLLVGAAMTQAPELFRAVVCQVPLLDMVRYHRFGSGQTWTREYGNPDQAEDFAWLHAYSPYHRLVAGTRYPALLMMSADSDDRVDPMHARKFVAAARAATASDHPVLLRIERQAGHGGADMVSRQIESLADTYSFLMHQLGMWPAAGAEQP